MFLFLCVFGGLAWYDEGRRWDNFQDGRKYEQPNAKKFKLYESDFYKVISKGDLEEMRWWGDEEITWSFWGRTWGIIFLVKILGDHFGGFGGWWERSCGNEVCKSLS
jgi:hypothetical protein